MSERQLDNWLDGFMFYTRESECPDSYLTWSALHTLAAATQRKVHVPWVYSEFYTNIYIMLVGPPGITHKNAAIGFSRKALKAVDVPIASEGISREALIQQMSRRGKDSDSLAAMSPEFPTLIRTSGPTMVEFLTHIFDCEDDFEYTTKSGGTDKIPRPFLTLYTGATPGWLADEFDQTFIDQGFSARTLFVAENAPRFRKAFTRITPEMLEVHKKLLQDLEVVTQLEGQFSWTPEAISWFEHWYEEILPRQDIDYRLKGYLGRKPTHLLKIGQLIILNKGSTTKTSDLRLTPEALKEALTYLEAIEPNMVEAFKAVGRNPFANDLERIAHEVKVSGGMSHAELIERNVHALKKQELDEVIDNLQDMRIISTRLKGGQKWHFLTEDLE